MHPGHARDVSSRLSSQNTGYLLVSEQTGHANRKQAKHGSVPVYQYVQVAECFQHYLVLKDFATGGHLPPEPPAALRRHADTFDTGVTVVSCKVWATANCTLSLVAINALG